MNTIVDISDEIYSELGSPSDLSLPLISYWLQRNIGVLNSLIQTSYSILITNISPQSIEINPELGEDEKSIYKKAYYIYWYDKLIRANLGAANWDVALEVDSDGATVKTVNKNEIAKTFLMLKKANQEELDELITGYYLNRTTPLAVAGSDDIAAGPYHAGGTTFNRRDY